jgi:hypothetical protein
MKKELCTEARQADTFVRIERPSPVKACMHICVNDAFQVHCIMRLPRHLYKSFIRHSELACKLLTVAHG